MTKSFFKGLTWRALLALLLSLGFLFTCLMRSRKDGDAREQEHFKQEYGSLLLAEEYRALKTDVLKEHPDVKAVYSAYDNTGKLVGYILDVKMNTEIGEIHTQMSISENGAKILNIRVLDDDPQSPLFSALEMEEVRYQLQDKRIPVGIRRERAVDVVSPIEYDPLLGLHDGVYFAQAEKAGKDGYLDFCEMEVRGGRIVRVEWDAKNEQTHTNRSTDSISGEYKVSGNIWAEQSYRLCNYLVMVQDPVKLAMKSDGQTEIIDGVTIPIAPFVELVNQCIEYSRTSYTKDQYLASGSEDGNGEENADPTPTPVPDTNTTETTAALETSQAAEPSHTSSEIGVIGGEDGVVTGDATNVLSESIDGIPMSEIRSYIDGITDKPEESAALLSTVNQAYKFMREYLNWVG